MARTKPFEAVEVEVKSQVQFRCGACNTRQIQMLEVSIEKKYGYYDDVTNYYEAEATCNKCGSENKIRKMIW